MHRTIAEGFATEDGKTLFQQSEALGTRLEDTEANTWQEEIAQAVIASGQALNSVATDLGTGNYNAARQLSDAIAALDAAYAVKSFAARLWNPGALGEFVDFDLRYIVHGLGKMTTILCPTVSFGSTPVTSTLTLRIGTPALAALPNYLQPAILPVVGLENALYRFPLMVKSLGGSKLNGFVEVEQFGVNDGDWYVFRQDGVNWSNTNNTIWGFSHTYINQSGTP